jgi:hypothetical protein
MEKGNAKRGWLYGSVIGALGLPSVVLAYFFGTESSLYALHHVDESCGLGILLMPVAAFVLALIGLAFGAFAGASLDANAGILRKPLLIIGIISALLAIFGFTQETSTYKAPATPMRCYI